MKQRVWMDISELKNWSGAFTGIQRVVFNLGRDLKELEELDIRLCRFDYRRKVFVETDYEFIEHVYTEKPKNEVVTNSTRTSMVGFVKKSLPTPVKKGIKSIIGFSSPPYISIKKRIPIENGDLLFLAGAFWTGQVEGVKKLQQQKKIRVAAVMYDTVPVVMPELCTRVTEIDFNREIKGAVKTIDLWISISKNTKKDLLRYIASKSIRKVAEHDVITLGSDINTGGSSRSPFKSSKEPKDFILLVSTLEARKNQQIAYQVVKLAEERGETLPPIVLVGKHGWHSDDLVSILKRDKTLKNKIIWLESADDSMLRWLYQNCLFTVYPSFYEGWGLPVAESVAYGKFCLASHSSSIPEVAGDLIDYFSPYDASALLEKILHYSLDKSALKSREKNLSKYSQPTWKSTAAEVNRILSSK